MTSWDAQKRPTHNLELNQSCREPRIVVSTIINDGKVGVKHQRIRSPLPRPRDAHICASQNAIYIMKDSQLHPRLPLQSPNDPFHFLFIEPTLPITPQGTRQSYLLFILVQMLRVRTPVPLCFSASTYTNLTAGDWNPGLIARLYLSLEDG